MPIYNMTNVTNTTNLAELYQGVNSLTGTSILNVTAVFVIVGWVITLIGLKAWQGKQAFAASTFAFSIISFLLWTAQLINILIFVAFMFMSAGGLAYLVFSKD